VTSALENIINEKDKVISDKEAQIKRLLKKIDECNKEYGQLTQLYKTLLQ
jgi:F0F1-type ATP synthase membrane subunit b/b'